jgi:hypothetical protein
MEQLKPICVAANHVPAEAEAKRRAASRRVIIQVVTSCVACELSLELRPIHMLIPVLLVSCKIQNATRMVTDGRPIP